MAITDTRLDELEAVVVGGLDRLTEADVHALDRYMRAREGAVVRLPDQRVERGPVRELMPEATERLLERPARLRSAGQAAALQTSELLIARDLPPGSDVIAAVDDGGAVAASPPRGGGRLLVSGALDAWRFRSLDDAAFDRFWRSTIAGLALAAPPLVDVAVTPAGLRPDQPAEVVARVRSPQLATLKGSPYGPTVSATVDGQPLRLGSRRRARRLSRKDGRRRESRPRRRRSAGIRRRFRRAADGSTHRADRLRRASCGPGGRRGRGLS